MDGPTLDRLDLRLGQGTSTKLAASIYSIIQMRDFEREREKNECTGRIKDGNGCDSNRIRIGLTEMFPHVPARPLGPVLPRAWNGGPRHLVDTGARRSGSTNCSRGNDIPRHEVIHI